MRLIRPARAVALVAALTLAAACTTSNEDTGSTAAGVQGATGKAETAAKTYKLGLGLPLTGSAAAYGEEYRAVTEMGVKKANEDFAADGIKIELVTADTQATAEGGVNAANKLGAVEKAPAILTGWGTVVQASMPIAVDRGFALLNAGVQTSTLVGASPNLVNLLPMNNSMFTDYASHLTKTLGYKKFAYIAIDTDTGRAAAEEFAKAVKDAGGEIVATESIRQDATDATAQIAKIKAANPDFMYMHALLVDGASILKAAREADLKSVIGTYTAVAESAVIREAGKEKSNNMLYVSHLPKDVDGTRGLLKSLRESHPKMVIANQSYDPYWYSTPFLYAQVIKKLRAQGAPVTGANVLAVMREAKDLNVPIIGPVDLTNKLTYKAPTTIRQIKDWKADPLDDATVASVSSDD